MPDATVDTARTNLAVPNELRERIEREAEIDLRTYKAQILVLLDEALKSRERRR